MIDRSRDIGEGRWSASQRRASAMADNSAVRSVWASAPRKKEEEGKVITGPNNSAIDFTKFILVDIDFGATLDYLDSISCCGTASWLGTDCITDDVLWCAGSGGGGAGGDSKGVGRGILEGSNGL